MDKVKAPDRTMLRTAVLVTGIAILTIFAAVGSSAKLIPMDRIDGDDEAVRVADENGNEESEAAAQARFPHNTAQHTRLPCLVCHVRPDNSSVPRRSAGHIPCASCHTEQFNDPNSTMCAICHTDASTGAMKRFPGLRSFNTRFNHGRHLRQTGCATCHKPVQRGVALSIPVGTAGHTTCFQCHGPQTKIGSCGTCHQPGRPVRTPQTSRAYRLNFSHQEHTARGKTNCSSCHTVLAGGARGRQVTSPAVSMHFAQAGRASCAACHNNKRAFGPEDFSNCKRCHEGRTFSF